MKIKAIVLLVTMLGLAVGVASAQSTEPVTFRTPFAFVIGDQVLPAGEYTVRPVSVSGTLSFRGADGMNVFIHSIPLYRRDSSEKYRIVFHRYGQRYWLSELWAPGYSTGRIVQQHPSERLMAKISAPEHVTLYLGH